MARRHEFAAGGREREGGYGGWVGEHCVCALACWERREEVSGCVDGRDREGEGEGVKDG